MPLVQSSTSGMGTYPGQIAPALMTRALPVDVSLLFTQNWTYTMSGPLSASGPGGAAFQADLDTGRMDGFWVIDVQTLKVSANNETYQLALLGSNDPAFQPYNCDVLAFHDWAAVGSGRIVPSLGAPAPPIPKPGESVRRYAKPFSTLCGGFIFRYLQAYLTVGGTAPSIQMSSWVVPLKSTSF